jgi:hypothetical protein
MELQNQRCSLGDRCKLTDEIIEFGKQILGCLGTEIDQLGNSHLIELLIDED